MNGTQAQLGYEKRQKTILSTEKSHRNFREENYVCFDC